MASEVNISAAELAASATRVEPGTFEPSRHFYPRTQSAQVHPLVSFFARLGRTRIVQRYCHLHPRVVPAHLDEILSSQPRFFRWAGADLFHVTSESGVRQMIVIETNSCPSGNKSMPLLSDEQEEGGYRTLVEEAFLPLLGKRAGKNGGDLAVLYDKNSMEASGYAAAMAGLTGEAVWLVPYPDVAGAPARWDDGVLSVRDSAGLWHPVRAALRYVTQRPWNRIPIHTRTLVFNPVIACLAGGRNKLVAAKAYDLYNAELLPSGLEIRTPETIRDLHHEEIPLWVQRFGGNAVVKVPYSNAGQGVFTIVGQEELEAFMAREQRYDRYIVQSLIGDSRWSSRTSRGRLYQVGTVPNKSGQIFVADLRMMVCAGCDGFRPLAIYARRARAPLGETHGRDPSSFAGASSWDVLGTNLSERTAGGWATDTDRLMLMDRRDFNLLGLGLDDLVEGYIQTVLSVIAIDRLAQTLVNQKGKLRRRLFRTLDDDDALLAELLA